ncbi:MAG: hypothetical protein K2X06_15100 [Burkholderiales bacterium]|nr:hypothetical protein [Burkholderiales bacterium]
MQPRLAALCCACAALWLQPALAQQPARANPADPRAETPPPRHQSAFDGYRPLRDEKIQSWRDINDEVARTGGHIGIFGGAAHAGHGAHPAPAPARPGAAK